MSGSAALGFIEFADRKLDPSVVGNKAARLAQVHHAGFPVPAFFVIGGAARDADEAVVRREIDSALDRLSPGDGLVAVRSSAADEDGAKRSFAGQLDSFLEVSREDVFERARDVWRSADAPHVRAYRETLGLAGEQATPTVIVQRMVPAVSAGVAFAADPVTGDRDVAVVAAGHGLAEALVGGACQGDTWRVDSGGVIVDRDVDTSRISVSLDDRQAKRVARLAREVSVIFGHPQDIEWAFDGRRLQLLQSRDITTLPPPPADYALWDNSNIVESYGGVTAPLTFSVARSAYSAAYRHLGRLIGITERDIERNARSYEQMIGLIQGRVYYNLLSWYRLLKLTPGYRFNRRFMEQMMGVTEGLPGDALPAHGSQGWFMRLRGATGLARGAIRLAFGLCVHDSRVRAFHREIELALRPVDLSRMSCGELVDYYEALQGRVIPAWDTPLINDLYCMIFHGLLGRLCERWLPAGPDGVHNDLVSGEAGIVSLEPVRRIRRMAAIAARDDEFVALLCSAPLSAIEDGLALNGSFDAEFQAYLRRFGDRCIDELKLESETLADDPLPALRAIGQLASVREPEVAQTATDDPRMAAERDSMHALGGSRTRRLVFKRILGLARARVRDRENLRFERTRVYGRVRCVFVEIGKRLADAGAIDACDDIFYLEADEIVRFVRGTGFAGRPGILAGARRVEFDGYRAQAGPPRRFVTRGPAQLETSIQPVVAGHADADADRRRGQACSPGIVAGPVRIVRDPRNADVKTGDILVAERTDPGWVTVFPLVSGMIMERGSLLSHSAIVARELRIPAVVGVADACDWLRDGEWVELDGATGIIRRLGQSECAA